MNLESESIDRAVIIRPVAGDWALDALQVFGEKIKEAAEEKRGIGLGMTAFNPEVKEVLDGIQALCEEARIPMVLFDWPAELEPSLIGEGYETVPTADEAVDFLFMEWLERDLESEL